MDPDEAVKGLDRHQLADAYQLVLPWMKHALYRFLCHAQDGIAVVGVIQDSCAFNRREDPEADGAAVVQLLNRADKEIKGILSWVFGQENDFDTILGGVNLLAVADNGQRVVTNLLEALQPILVEGAERCAKEKVDAALRKAKSRRGEAK